MVELFPSCKGIYFVLAILLVSKCTCDVNIEFIALFESVHASIQEGTIEVKAKKVIKIQLLGSNFDNSTFISFAEKSKGKGASCVDERVTAPVAIVRKTDKVAFASVNFQKTSGITYYICAKSGSNSSSWKYQGSSKFLKIIVQKTTFALPLWVSIIMIGVLMILSGLFSGLNLGLMSLDPNELKLVANSGTANQKKHAKKILPVRRHGNFLLCTLLLGNTLVNSSFTILLDGLTGGIVAIIGSTLAIVVMGEIVPQSVCSRYGLAVGAYTIWLTKLFMILTFPLSFPVSKLLDCILGKELGNVYNRTQLLEMLKLQDEYNDLEKDEVGIISGALKYRSKTVEEVMTSLEDCFLLDEEAVLDFKTMSAIIQTGYSRIPIYSKERSNIVALLFVKDLAFVDPDDCIPLLSVIKFYNHRVHKVFFDTTLDKMLEEFKQGTTHLSVVLKINDTGEGDPVYESIGIVTLEDIIEEIIQAEIVDETDVYVDNVSGKKVHRKHHNQDFTLFLPAPTETQPKLSPQLVFAIYQYLCTAVSAFSEELVSRTVLKKLIEHPGVVEEQDLNPEQEEKNVCLYKKGSPTDFFILILQGRVEVVIGNENIEFEDGPFSMFGINALTSESGKPYTPDFTVKVLVKTQYLKIPKSLYRSAIRATKMERNNKLPDTFQEYDEIFWKHAPKNSANVDFDSRSTSSSIKDRRHSTGKSHKANLLRRLTPKLDKRKDSLQEKQAAASLYDAGLENPLISPRNETNVLSTPTKCLSNDDDNTSV